MGPIVTSGELALKLAGEGQLDMLPLLSFVTTT